MARYDESPPGEIFPGITNPLSTGAPGSATAPYSLPAGAGKTTATITPVYGGAYQAMVDGDDTELPSQATLYGGTEAISGVHLDAGGDGPYQPGGQGHVVGNPHPGAGR